MKKDRNVFLFLVGLLFFSISTNGQSTQIKEICGSDTIRITLDNYQYGKIDWQESHDGVHWNTIDNKHDTVLLLHTTEEKYIRGCITTSICEQVFSTPLHIHQKPEAFAGLDKVVMLDTIALKGNVVPGAQGKWDIIGGESGILEKVDDAVSLLSGPDSAYYLTWTLSDEVCGVSTDTLKVTFVENEYNPNRVIVDQTDYIDPALSDFNAGIYYIRFSEVIPVPDSSILIGYAGEGFLLKVLSQDQINDSTYRFYTSQGTIEDLLIEGVLNLGDDIDLTESYKKSSGSVTLLDHLPNRHEILTDPKYKKGTHIYYFPDELNPASVIQPSSSTKGGADLFEMKNVSVEIDLTDDISLEVGLDGEINFDPNFVFDYRIKCGFPHKWWKFECGLNYLKAGLENAVLTNSLTVSMLCEASVGDTLYKKNKSKKLFDKTGTKVIIAGTVPILVANKVSLELYILPELSASIGASFSWERSSSFSAYMLYKNSSLKPVLQKGPSYNSTSYTVEVKGNAGVNFVLVPKMDMKVYGIAGPYFKVPLSLKPGVCASARTVDGGAIQDTWGINAPLSLDAELGCKVEIFKKVLFKSSVGTNIFSTGFFNPYEINMISGNNQEAPPFAEPEKPFRVQVKNNLGYNSAGIPVYFSVLEGDGTFDDEKVYTGLDGYAESYLTLGQESYNKVKVDAFTCDFEDLKGADDVIFEVNTGCQNSSLQLAFDFHEDKTVEPYGIMGTPPYQYSLDGENYSSDPPIMDILMAIEQEYFYVKDAGGCMASDRVEAIDSCLYSELSVSVNIVATNATVTGSKGTPPYLYALDKETVYSAENEFDYLTIGDHEVFVTDQSGCTASKTFNISVNTTDSLLAYYPFNGNAQDESGNFHDGILNGATFVSDRFLDSASACSIKDHNAIVVPAADQLVFKDDFTISLWHSPSPDGYYSLFSIGDFEDEQGLHFVLYFNDNIFTYHLFGKSIESGISWEEAFDPIAVEAWHMYTIRRAADTISLFRDDQFIDKFNSPGEIGSELDFHFGNIANAQYNPGVLDDICIYSRALAPSEMLNLYHDNGWNDGFLNEPLIDPRDGIVYRQVRIGEQVWMGENLKATKYNDGTNIPYVTDALEWSERTADAYCWYNNDSIRYASTYGALYNGYVLENENICPEEWHVPTFDDWNELVNYLGGSAVAGGKLKEKGTSHWITPNSGASDEKSFTALPAGTRFGSGAFNFIEEVGDWWSSSLYESMNETLTYKTMYIKNNEIIVHYQGLIAGNGISIRCIRDKD